MPSDEVRAAIERVLSGLNYRERKIVIGRLSALANESAVVEMMDKEYDDAGEDNYGPDCMSAALRALARACKL